ncbi:hypothetical protein GGD81_003841 [Rhodobium orientis]|uniref:Uncharacterized protein n=1 Tax=Rhodobium orientis TaxID=34017 RepID=A0A327JRF6_9HYPH|nr:hypothetical protein [Rhodobium orientis]MBB4304777.1 hypothetical protein [Rhodobium orientis]MBK5948048.1 hypothetical protein [Rhodobium orientis]RAI27482.1 hypothetical protein CH339_10355 [Rhodobium orientis]
MKTTTAFLLGAAFVLAPTLASADPTTTFTCRSGRLCNLVCNNSGSTTQLVNLTDVESGNIYMQGTAILYEMLRGDGSEPALISVSNNTYCYLTESGPE